MCCETFALRTDFMARKEPHTVALHKSSQNTTTFLTPTRCNCLHCEICATCHTFKKRASSHTVYSPLIRFPQLARTDAARRSSDGHLAEMAPFLDARAQTLSCTSSAAFAALRHPKHRRRAYALFVPSFVVLGGLSYINSTYYPSDAPISQSNSCT